jgi:hypothetical protein
MTRPTQDPHVVIEARGGGWVRYRADDGRRWEAHGSCDHRGDCLIGGVATTPDGPVLVRDHAHLAALRARYGLRMGNDLDNVLAPGFAGCCEYRFRELPPAAP